jgi:hypothetical protein
VECGWPCNSFLHDRHGKHQLELVTAADCKKESTAVLHSTLAITLLMGSASAQVETSPQSCRDVEVTLRIVPTTFRQGIHQNFIVVLKNVSAKPVRLIDVRAGRRPDLAHSYYAVMFEKNERALKDLPRAISDPGPIGPADFFVLPPRAILEVPVTTPADLSGLRAGHYSAHVRVTLDLFSKRVSQCRSARTSFTVIK